MFSKAALKTHLTVLLITILAGCGSGGGGGVQVTTTDLVSISVTPADTAIAVNTDQQYMATGIYADNSTRDVTALVTWSSTDASVATISEETDSTSSISGFFAHSSTGDRHIHAWGRAHGRTTIQASTGGLTGSTSLSVTLATLVSLAITPASPTIAKGTNQQFTATGTFSDNTTQDLTYTVTWSSSNTTVAAISNVAGSKGLATSTAAGSTTIAVASGNVSASTTLTVNPATLVSLAITPANPTIAKGTNQQFTAMGTFSDNTTQDLTNSVTWSSSNTGAATISNAAGSTGLATSVAAGSTTITASSGSVSASASLTVNLATLVSLAIAPANPAIAKGTNKQFTATGTYSDSTTQNLTNSVTWSSSNTGVATISNAAGSKGLATPVAAGSTTVTAASGSISASTTLTVNAATLVSLAITPANPAIAKGTNQQFTATGTYTDSSTQNLTNSVTWSSSNTGVATISNAAGSKGLATPVAAGSTTVTAASGSISASTSLTVNAATLVSLAITPANPTIANGTNQQFAATGTYSDSTTQDLTNTVTWTSSNTGVATISNAAGSKGLATAAAAGSTTISAVSGNVSGTATLTVTGNGTAALTWNAPTTRTDGSALNPVTDLQKYRVYYGPASGTYTQYVEVVNPGIDTVSYTLTLGSGTYYFAVTVVDILGQESGYSNEAFKTL